ncbi:MAG: hypothetical protein V1887_02275 [Candidatus Aenigmatarchaeota archaeon]
MSGEYVAYAAGLILAYIAYEGITYQFAKNVRGSPDEVSVLMWTGPITGFFYSQPRLHELAGEKKARDKA